MISRATARRLAFALLLGGALLVSPPAVSGGVPWDLGVAFGYVCAILCVCLYVFPVRGDGLPHARLLGLSQHRAIGWCLLAAGTLHAVVLIVVQPLVGQRYFLPSSPLFMWCGIAALVLAGVLVKTGLAARSALRQSGSMGLASTHIVLAALMVLTLWAHLIGSGQLISGAVKTLGVLLLLVLPLGWFALRRRGRRAPQGELRRNSHIVTMAAALFVPTPLVNQYLLEPAARPAAIPISFPHEKHTSVTCVTCHHNFLDHTGLTACIECHRSNRPDLGRSSESTFHTFCRDCHTQLAVQGAAHGPTRSCSECHHGIRSSSL